MGGSVANKWADHRQKKLYLNSTVEDLIPFKEEHQGLLKLHVPLQAFSGPQEEVGFLCGEKNEVISKNGIFFEEEK